MLNQKKQEIKFEIMKKPNIKKLTTIITENDDNQQIREITAQILDKYRFDKIICFGSKMNKSEKVSCFLDSTGATQLPTELNSYCLLLMPSNDEKCPDNQIQQRLEEEFKSSVSLTIIVHRMLEFNAALNNGSSFFISIYKKGIVLHDNYEELFITPAKGKPINIRITKKETFWTHWHSLSKNFIKGGQLFIDEKDNGIAVFMLHQALQHCYSAMLRVLIGYRTNSNSLRRLLKLIEIALPHSSFIKPHKITPEDSRLSGLLLKGFSDARYDNTFEATTEDLVAMIGRINEILDHANTICLERIGNLKSGKTTYLA